MTLFTGDADVVKRVIVLLSSQQPPAWVLVGWGGRQLLPSRRVVRDGGGGLLASPLFERQLQWHREATNVRIQTTWLFLK